MAEIATVFKTLSVLKNSAKLKVLHDYVYIDNFVFKLHYRATFLALVICSLLVSSRQFIGEHIKCIPSDGMKNYVKPIESFCFFTSTYTVVKHMNLTSVELGVIAHPGVGPADPMKDEVVFHAYYQWVPFVLFFQGIFFYLPHYLWKTREGGRLKNLVGGLRLASLSLSEDDVKISDDLTIPSRQNHENKITIIRNAFLNRLHANRPWATILVLCEVLNLINVLMQIYLTNLFLGGAFWDLGQKVTDRSASFEGRVDVLDLIFPKMTKCIFYKTGPSGTIVPQDALCVMALNVINEKIYTFLWFWMIILAIITILGLVWRIMTMVLHARSEKFNKFVFALACPGRQNPWKVLTVTREYNFNDWLFLYYVAKNLENSVFKELFQKLAEDLDERRNLAYNRPLPTLPRNKKEAEAELLPFYHDESKLA